MIFVPDKRMFKNLLPTHPIILIVNQTSLDKIFCIGSYIGVVWKFQRCMQ